MKNKRLTIIGLPAALLLTVACAYAVSGDTHKDDGHDHGDATLPEGMHVDPGDPTPHKDHDDEAGHGHDHGDDGGHVLEDANAHSDETATVRLTADQLRRYKIEVTEATQGSLATSIRVPGDIKMNSNQLARVTPRVAGVVGEVYVNLGDKVEEGAPLVLIESRALGDAKTAYLAAQSRQALANATYEREKLLHEQEISAEHDYLSAKQAVAETGIQVRNARQQLLTLGLTRSAIGKLSTEAEESFAACTVNAPFGGTIIKKEVTLGQAVDSTLHLFEIADLSTVWVELVLTQNEVTLVKTGQSVTITPLAGNASATGTISYAAPFLDAETRTAMARVVLDNATGQYRPGMSVEGRIQVADSPNTVLVPAGSVQYLGEQPCVFVMTARGFDMREVAMGASDGRQIEIVKGLTASEPVVTRNAFHLKAELEKLASGGAVGHGHAH